jgi:hypothetical protein
MVTLRTYAMPWEAQLARARLAAEGIEGTIPEEHLSRLYCGNAGGVRLQVRAADLEHAEELLHRLQPIPEIYLVTEDDVARRRCPTCLSEDVGRRAFAASRTVLGVPLPVPELRWVCRGCGAAWKEEGPEGPEAAAEGPADELVTVARFTTPWEAHLARTRLESEGVEACVLEERLPPVDLLSGRPLALNRVAVHAEDAELARDLLAEQEGDGVEPVPASE